ncbi:MAG TPA: PilZ domain-containing protein [Rhizomicrobium sp.]
MSTSGSGRESNPIREESRGGERRRAFLSGMIISRDGTRSVGCTIRDISNGGARITLARDAIVPAQLYLLSSRHAVGYEVHIAWRSATQAGLKITAEHRLSAAMDADLLFLWRLFLELGPRATTPFDF